MEEQLQKEPGIFVNKVPLWINNIKIINKEMHLRIPFETSFGRFDSLTRFFPVIEFKKEDGEIIKGIGECSPLSAPWYDYQCHRSVDTALQYIIAGLTGKTVDEADGYSASDNLPVTDVNSFIEKYKWIVGHNMAKAGVEAAYWDAIAKLQNVPVSKLWGGEKQSVTAGTSVGLEATPELLMRKIETAADELKAARIKVKVKPGYDIKYLDAIRKKYPDILLMADANAAYDLFNPSHISLLKEFDNYNLMMIEQPGHHDDIIDHSRQLSELDTPICLDESILHADHTRKAIDLWKQYSSTEKLIINIKPPRVGGYHEAIKIAKLCGKNGVSAWCGGMLESALGKTGNVHFSLIEGSKSARRSYFTSPLFY